MKGKDPRDAHFITSRIRGICGDHHATCSVYNQNMADGVRPPHLGERIINLGESAEYMFDHNIFQENLVGVDFCERMAGETNPGVLELANRTEAPHGAGWSPAGLVTGRAGQPPGRALVLAGHLPGWRCPPSRPAGTPRGPGGRPSRGP